MDFGWDPSQNDLHDRMRALGSEADRAHPDERLGLLARGGALGLPLPQDAGGGGFDLVSTAYAYEGLGATLRDAGVLLAAGGHLFGVALVVAKAGTADQKAILLPRLARGETIATVAATEVESGSDMASIRAVAEREGDRFHVTGAKRYVTFADRADMFLVFARDGQAGRGLTALLIPRTADGIAIGAPLRTAGLSGARLAPVTFSGSPAGPDGLIGRAGAGMAVFQMAMTFERALVLAFRLGALGRALDEAVHFVRSREVGGIPIAKHQAVSHRIARMKLRLEASRWLVYRAAWALDRGERAQAEAALAKWHLAGAALASSLDDVKLHGGAGFLEESGLPSVVDDAMGGLMHSGTEDVLATIVARWMGV